MYQAAGFALCTSISILWIQEKTEEKLVKEKINISEKCNHKEHHRQAQALV